MFTNYSHGKDAPWILVMSSTTGSSQTQWNQHIQMSSQLFIPDGEPSSS